LARIQRQEDISFTIANAENAAGGRGLTRAVMDEILGAGIDVITMGNHVWDNKDIFNFIDDEFRLLRPANYPSPCPGQGYHLYKAGFSKNIGIINLSGRVFVSNLECPFKLMDSILSEVEDQADIIIVDFHAEATSEKLAFAYYVDGRATAVLGTHTHIQTSDERILPRGTAYITDLGMTGPSDSVLGMDKEIVIEKFLTGRPARFEVASGSAQLQGVILRLDDNTDQVLEIKRISILYSE
jgi:metallophosphoesterase (TIGR00282 family)